MVAEAKTSAIAKLSGFIVNMMSKAKPSLIAKERDCTTVLCSPTQNGEDLYGWLEPNGVFHEVKWGDHQKFAFDTIRKRNWFNDFGESYEHAQLCSGDFLTDVKGWVLLHNPSRGVAFVTRGENKGITKAQAEFLYDYYQSRGMRDVASQYVSEL